MNISTPIQALSSNENGNAENSNFVENILGDSQLGWSQKAQKKNKSGFFAKLLDGLTVKGKKGLSPPELEGLDISNRAEGELSPEKTAKNSLKPGLITKKTNIPGNNSDVLPGTFQVFPGFSEFPPELNLNFLSGKGALRTLRTDRPAFAGADASQKNDFSGGELFGKGETGAGSDISDALSAFAMGRPVKGNAGIPGGDKAKNAAAKEGAANVFSASFRDLEAEIFQSQFRAGLLKGENNEKENSRFAELRGKKGKERLNIEVRDLRTGEERNAGPGGVFKEISLNGARQNQEIELPVHLNLLSESMDEKGAGTAGKEISLSQRFEDALARELQGNLSADIVKDAALIIRNGGEGTIRLSLRPASLGDIKIRLEMTENKITGHIIVESKEALRAFERELPVLEKAFKDSGFSETNLQMFLAQDGRNYAGSGQGQEEYLSALASGIAASRYESELTQIESLPDLMAPHGSTQVNLLV